jgi:hypothetical protein
MIKGFGKMLRRCAAVCGLALSALALVPSAHAESQLLGFGGESVSGYLGLSQDVVIQTAGKLTLEVYDMGIPQSMFERLESLSFNVTRDTTTMLASRVGEGSLVVDIGAAGLYSISISAMANPNSPMGMGGISWRATFDPIAPVPLPASVWLLLAGLAWATGMQRKRAKLAANESNRSFPLWGGSPALAH